MTLGAVLAVWLASSSGVAAGAAVVAGIDQLRFGVARGEAWAHVRALTGYALAFGIVAEAVAQAGQIDRINWQTWAYLVASILAAEGTITVTVLARRRRKEHA